MVKFWSNEVTKIDEKTFDVTFPSKYFFWDGTEDYQHKTDKFELPISTFLHIEIWDEKPIERTDEAVTLKVYHVECPKLIDDAFDHFEERKAEIEKKKGKKWLDILKDVLNEVKDTTGQGYSKTYKPHWDRLPYNNDNLFKVPLPPFTALPTLEESEKTKKKRKKKYLYEPTLEELKETYFYNRKTLKEAVEREKGEKFPIGGLMQPLYVEYSHSTKKKSTYDDSEILCIEAVVEKDKIKNFKTMKYERSKSVEKKMSWKDLYNNEYMTKNTAKQLYMQHNWKSSEKAWEILSWVTTFELGDVWTYSDNFLKLERLYFDDVTLYENLPSVGIDKVMEIHKTLVKIEEKISQQQKYLTEDCVKKVHLIWKILCKNSNMGPKVFWEGVFDFNRKSLYDEIILSEYYDSIKVDLDVYKYIKKKYGAYNDLFITFTKMLKSKGWKSGIWTGFKLNPPKAYKLKF